jgi:hypothetical protein
MHELIDFNVYLYVLVVDELFARGFKTLCIRSIIVPQTLDTISTHKSIQKIVRKDKTYNAKIDIIETNLSIIRARCSLLNCGILIT